MNDVRRLAGALRHWPNATLRAPAVLPFRDLRQFLTAYRGSWPGRTGSTSLHVRGDAQPYLIRHGTSDFAVFCEVMVQREYACIPDMDSVRTIVDAGANVGFASRYLVHRFPEAHVIALEPEPENFQAASVNLRHLKGRCTLIQGALWPRSTQVEVVKGRFRDGREWATQVQDTPEPFGPTCPALSVSDLMMRFGLPRIDVLKIDIEGAELDLFAGDTTFMERVRCCAIELHDSDCARVFHTACHRHGFDLTSHHATTVATRNLRSRLRAVEEAVTVVP